MAQQVKVLAPNLDNRSSVPKLYKVGLLQIIL